MNETHRGGRRGGSAFLLAQIGAHAARGFARRVSELDLTPGQAGLLRLIAWQPGQSQQSLAGQLGTPASRLVRLVDALEERGLIERRRNPSDRRNYALYLTREGTGFMRRLGQVGTVHEDDVCAALSAAERELLGDLLARIAEQQGLVPGVHPGYAGALRPPAPCGRMAWPKILAGWATEMCSAANLSLAGLIR